MISFALGEEIVEYSKTLGWYAGKKLTIFGQYFETGKGIVVTILKTRRGTYQKPFLHVGMVFLAVTAILSAPVLVDQYPMGALATSPNVAQDAAAVLSAQVDISNVDTQTKESEKPRRDVVEYTVSQGDTLSSIAKSYGVDVSSIAILNDFSANKLLRPGDKIKIPPVSGLVIIVKSGDTIASLAKKYGLLSPQPIVDWPYNTFANDELFTLTAGQTLVIPGGKPPEEIIVAPIARRVGPSGPFTPGSGQFSWPTSGVITQYFASYHQADDIAAPIGTLVSAADSGRVILVQYLNWGYGYHVIVDHGNGYQTLYGHLSRIDVGVGDNLSRGQRIGLMGSTGRSTGSHLHFEIRKNGNFQNPLDYLR